MWRKASVTQLLCGLERIPEHCLLTPLLNNLKRGRLIDVGANVGLYTLFLRARSSLPIVAYEPQPFLHQLLKMTQDHNRLPNVTLRNMAVGAERGEVLFHTGVNGGVLNNANAVAATLDAFPVGGWEASAEATFKARPTVRVPVVSLDEDLAEGESVSLLKIDCEGFERNVLAGARRIMEEDNPRLFLEVHPTLLPAFGQKVEDVLELVRPHYNLEFWCFQPRWQQTKLMRSLSKFCIPKGKRFAGEAEMLDAVNDQHPPSQVYFIGHPKRQRG